MPANRIGYTQLSLAQLKILQEVDHAQPCSCRSRCSTCGQPLKLDYLWAALCILGAVYFIFRAPGTP